MKRLTLLLLISLSLVACYGESKPTEVTIIHVEATEGWAKSCIGGANYNTTVKTTEGYVDTLCGYCGKTGDKIQGFWRSGHWDGSLNGFRTNH